MFKWFSICLYIQTARDLWLVNTKEKLAFSRLNDPVICLRSTGVLVQT